MLREWPGIQCGWSREERRREGGAGVWRCANDAGLWGGALGWLSIATPSPAPQATVGTGCRGRSWGSGRLWQLSDKGHGGGGSGWIRCDFSSRAGWVGHQGCAQGGLMTVKGIHLWRRQLEAQQSPPGQSLVELSSEVRPLALSPFPPGPEWGSRPAKPPGWRMQQTPCEASSSSSPT